MRCDSQTRALYLHWSCYRRPLSGTVCGIDACICWAAQRGKLRSSLSMHKRTTFVRFSNKKRTESTSRPTIEAGVGYLRPAWTSDAARIRIFVIPDGTQYRVKTKQYSCQKYLLITEFLQEILQDGYTRSKRYSRSSCISLLIFLRKTREKL